MGLAFPHTLSFCFFFHLLFLYTRGFLFLFLLLLSPFSLFSLQYTHTIHIHPPTHPPSHSQPKSAAARLERKAPEKKKEESVGGWEEPQAGRDLM